MVDRCVYEAVVCVGYLVRSSSTSAKVASRNENLSGMAVFDVDANRSEGFEILGAMSCARQDRRDKVS